MSEIIKKLYFLKKPLPPPTTLVPPQAKPKLRQQPGPGPDQVLGRTGLGSARFARALWGWVGVGGRGSWAGPVWVWLGGEPGWWGGGGRVLIFIKKVYF